MAWLTESRSAVIFVLVHEKRVSLKKYLKSHSFGYIVLTTSAGIMDHEEARRKNVGGKVLDLFLLFFFLLPSNLVGILLKILGGLSDFVEKVAGAYSLSRQVTSKVADSTTKLSNYEDFGRMKSEISQAEFSRNKPSDLPKV
uniref:Small ribosomal subunit protein uS8c n=1 Tax=Solanum lycopersicum TaxID=4081 RepID=A0A3Q7G5I6_SOLLC